MKFVYRFLLSSIACGCHNYATPPPQPEEAKVGAPSCQVPGSCITSAIPAAMLGVTGVRGIVVDGGAVGEPTGSAAQLLSYSGDAGAWRGVAISRDCTVSQTGAVTCTEMQGGEITAGASTGTLTCVGTATACGMAQAIAANGATPSSIFLTPQAPYPYDGGSPTAVQQTPGNVIAAIPLPNGVSDGNGQIEGYFQVARNGVVYADIGAYDFESLAGAIAAIYLGPGIVPGTSNFLFNSNGTNAVMNVPLPAGTFFLNVAGNYGPMLATSSGVQFGSAVSVDGFGSGVGVLGITAATIQPTAAVTGGGVLFAAPGTGSGSSGTDLYWWNGTTRYRVAGP